MGADAGAVSPGDVLVSDGSGQITWMQPDGSVVDVLQTGVSGHAARMATGPDSNIYVTHLSANRVTSLVPGGTQLGDFGSGYDSAPESLAFDSAGNLFVGLAEGTADVLKFDPDGNLVSRFDVAVEDRGADWIALADDCTLVYTSEGHTVFTYDVCTDTQGDPLATLPERPAFAVQVLQDGFVLVAASDTVYLLDIDGTTLQTYEHPDGTATWFGLDVARDEGSFWVSDTTNNRVVQFDIGTGAVLAETVIPTGATPWGVLVHDPPA